MDYNSGIASTLIVSLSPLFLNLESNKIHFLVIADRGMVIEDEFHPFFPKALGLVSLTRIFNFLD